MNGEVDRLPSAAAHPDHVGQATAIEQSRAIAEVQGAIVVAQQCPRDIQSALREMRDSCRQPRLAEKAFYSYPRAGSTVSGPSVHLARELARCFGNLQYGIAELRRDDAGGFSEMQAFAWDVERNTRSSLVFVVPHKRDVKGKPPKNLVDLRDIYENNTNMGARRLRQSIYSILPTWFTEEAAELCEQTLRDGGGKPLQQRIADCVKGFASLDITADQLEQRREQPAARWTEHDVAQLGVLFRSVQRGEITRDEAFPPRRVTSAEIAGAAKEPQP